MHNQLFLENTILLNGELNHYDIAVYIALKGIQLKNDIEREYFVNSDIIYYLLTGKTDCSTKVKTALKKSLNKLIDMKYIKVIATLSKDFYSLDLLPIYLPENAGDKKIGRYFTTFSKEEIRSILNLECKEDIFKLLRYFLVMIQSIDTDILNDKGVKYVGHMSQEFLASMSQITEKTTRSYNTILEDNKIIYVFHHEVQFASENEMFSAHNEYGRYADRVDIKKRGVTYESILKENGCKTFKRNDKKSSMTQKKQAIDNGKGSYTEEEIKEINEFVENSKESKVVNRNGLGNNDVEPSYIEDVKTCFFEEEEEEIDVDDGVVIEYTFS